MIHYSMDNSDNLQNELLDLLIEIFIQEMEGINTNDNILFKGIYNRPNIASTEGRD